MQIRNTHLKSNNMDKDIGLALITFDRPNYLKQSLSNLEKYNWGGATTKYVIVDEIYDSFKYSWLNDSKNFKVIYQKNSGVGKAKNLGLKKLISENCKHLFLIEDDILITSENTCTDYVSYAQITNVPHLNFALHGELNKGRKRIVEWQKKRGMILPICVYPDCVGAFSYYSDRIIKEIGFLDENFINAWEHVEHTFRISMSGEIPPFWFFMDHPDSENLLSEIPGSLLNSKIRSDPDWTRKMEDGIQYWIRKHGFFLPPRP